MGYLLMVEAFIRSFDRVISIPQYLMSMLQNLIYSLFAVSLQLTHFFPHELLRCGGVGRVEQWLAGSGPQNLVDRLTDT